MDNPAAAPKDSGFRSFSEFYPFYLSEHRHPVSRMLHYTGTWCAVLCLAALVMSGDPAWFIAALLSGYAFAFVLSLNEYIVAYMTVGFTMETLPIKIFNALRYGYTPTMASVTVLFVVTAAIIFGLIARFGDLPKLLGSMAADEK